MNVVVEYRLATVVDQHAATSAVVMEAVTQQRDQDLHVGQLRHVISQCLAECAHDTTRQHRLQRRHFQLVADIAVVRPQEMIGVNGLRRSEEHTSELQSLMRISYAVFCLKIKTNY